MALHPVKEEAVLVWINGLQLGEAVQRVTELQDGNLLLKLVYKLKGEEPSQAPVHLPQVQRLAIISDFLRSVCHVEEHILHMLAKEKMSELELTKVVLLLCFYGFINSSLVPTVGFETELQIATMLRFVQQEESGLLLSEGLDKLLTKSSLIQTSSVSSGSCHSEDGSPFFSRPRRPPLVSFVELNTVASSSLPCSPLQELMSTPQVQVKRLRNELAREEDVRDELERELAERVGLLAEKEGQMGQLQHRLQRLQRDQEEMEKLHKAALTELQQKNYGLLTRLHEVLKQCQDLKVDNGQKERRVDGLIEENGTLAAQARSAFAQLARAEEDVAKLAEAHSSSQVEWGTRRDVLQRELSQALTDRECLTEQIQILEGKISVLEDELAKLSQQHQEIGEVLGPIVEQEKLKQELTGLTLKLSQLEDIISLREKEKLDVETLLAEERISFKKETLCLEACVSDLQQSISNMQAEKAAQEQASWTKQETLASQIEALNIDLARLQPLEIRLTAEISASAQLRQQRGELEARVTSSEDLVNMLRSKCQNMESENTTQQEVLNAVGADLQNAQISLGEYEKKLSDHEKVVEENACLRTRIAALDDTVTNLQTEIDAERKRGDEILAAKALMEEKFKEQERKSQELFTELEALSQELHKMKQQKLDAESCIAKLTQEGIDLEGQRLAITQLTSQLADAEKLVSEKVEALEHLAQQLKDLKEELSVERQRAATMENGAKASKEAHEIQEQALRLEVTQLQQDIDGHLKNLKESLNTINSLNVEMSHQQDVALQKEQEVSVLAAQNKSLEENFARLQDKLAEVTSLVTERQSELLRLQEEVRHRENLRAQALETLKTEKEHLDLVNQSLLKDLEAAQKVEAELVSVQVVTQQRENELENQVKELQAKVKGFSTLADEREAEIRHLHLEVEQREASWLGAQESEKARRAELETKVAELQAQAEEASKLASELHFLRDQFGESEMQKQRAAQQEALDDLQKSGLLQEIKALKKEKKLLSSVNQSLQRGCEASQELSAALKGKLKGQAESIQALKEAIAKRDMQSQELQEQLKLEKAKTHYDGKTQLLDERQNLQVSLESSEREAKALKAEVKLVTMQLEKVEESEKRLMMRIRSLETQLYSANHQSKRERQSVLVRHRDGVHAKSPENPHRVSTDSVDLDDSLNGAGGKQPGPDTSSTPLVRSSERLAAKRHAQNGGSLETLYFTPMQQDRRRDHVSQDRRLESSITSLGELTLDSARKPSSSVKRRRTTQVINITMTKKTPLGGAANPDESFSLHSAQSQPNLASHGARPLTAVFEDSNTLHSLPGYRPRPARSGFLPRAASAFHIGAEDEPDHIADDWLRLAELQARNRTCLPHLKSSYALESRPSLGPAAPHITDEDVRTGDPIDSIRCASMVPSQLKDSIAAHRLSLAPPAADAHARGRAQSHRAPHVFKARETRGTRSPLATKRSAGQVLDPDTPELKKAVSCFPRTLRSASSQNIAPSPADRRQSMAFMIDNTPKQAVRGNSRLQRGLNKLRKSPRPTSKKSPKITSSAKKMFKMKM